MGKVRKERSKSLTPRQTRWNRKTILSDNSDADLISVTGEVLEEDCWEISSVSSVGTNENVRFSDDCESICSDSDTFQIDQDEENFKSDEPLYYNAQLSLKESIYLTTAFARKANLSRELMENLLGLVAVHLPKGVKYPRSTYKQEKILNIPHIEHRKHFYCDNYHDVQDGFCENCSRTYDESVLKQKGHYFVVYDIRFQIQQMLKNQNIKDQITNNILTKIGLEENDLRSRYGSSYGDKVKEWNFSGTINTDGVPVFKSSKYSFWPILLAIDEFPYLVRKSNIVLCGLWCGSKKIDINLVFPKLVVQLNDLSFNGVMWTNSLGEVCLSKLFINKCSVDAVARCIVQGMTQFNGAYGCGQCKDKGLVIQKGRGRCRIYKATTNIPLRTNSEHQDIVSSQNFKYGIKCHSPLLDLNKFGIISGMVVEPMHNLYLGVMKWIFSMWLNFRRSDCFLGSPEVVKTINERLMSCKVPTEIVRTVRSLDSIKHWKASEYRTTVFVMAVLTSDLLPRPYHKHFCKFANSVYVLSLEYCTAENIEKARKMLRSFVKGVSNLYGDEYLSFNVHSLLHLADSCANWGPLWQFSAFVFESFNATLLKFVSSSNGVPLQILKKFSIELQARYGGTNVFNNNEALKVFESITKLPKKQAELFYTKAPYVISELSDAMLQKCSELCVPEHIYSAKSAIIGGYLFKIKETKKRADCYIRIDSGCLGRIIRFLCVKCQCDPVPCDCTKEIAVVEIFRVEKVQSLEFAYKCSQSVRKREKLFNLQSLTSEKFFKMEYDGNMYFLSVCNLFEID